MSAFATARHLGVRLKRTVLHSLSPKSNESDKGSPKPEAGNNNHSPQFSRRDFIRKAGLGAAGLGAFSMLPSAAAKINVRDQLEMHGDLTINEHTLYLSDSQPNNPAPGDIWIDTSTDAS